MLMNTFTSDDLEKVIETFDDEECVEFFNDYKNLGEGSEDALYIMEDLDDYCDGSSPTTIFKIALDGNTFKTNMQFDLKAQYFADLFGDVTAIYEQDLKAFLKKELDPNGFIHWLLFSADDYNFSKKTEKALSAMKEKQIMKYTNLEMYNMLTSNMDYLFEEKGIDFDDLQQMAIYLIDNFSVDQWDQYDPRYERDPYLFGYVLDLGDGRKRKVATQYSGVAGKYWQEGNDGTYWMPVYF